MMMFRISTYLGIVFIFQNLRVTAGAAPVCESSATLAASYDRPVDYVLTNSLCTDSDPGDILTYTIDSGNTGNQFKIENGELKLAKPFGINYKFDLQITATDTSGETAVKTISVSVSSANEFEPVVIWPTINVRESVPRGTLLGACTVTDKDSTKGTLAGQTRVDFLNPTITAANKWVLDSHSCELYLNQQLNFDVKSTYALRMVAYDLDPVSPKTITHTAIINVLDVDDNPPTCTEYGKITTIQKRAVVGTDIDVVSCSDVDSGVNGQLSYYLDESNSPYVKTLFSVDRDSSLISLRSLILDDTIPFYDLLITVRDGGTPTLSTMVLVRVVVTDVPQDGPLPINRFKDAFSRSLSKYLGPVDSRNAEPLPTPNLDGLPYCKRYAVTAALSETTPVGTLVYDLGCRDPDGDSLTYTIVKGNVYSKFALKAGRLTTAKTLNADFRANYHLRLSVTDESQMHFSATVTVAVRVTNVNDNSPVIANPYPQITVSEGALYGEKIHVFTLNDKDPSTEPAGQVRIGWAQPDDSGARKWFLDSVNHGLYVNTELDYETEQTYIVELLAWDLDPTNSLTATTTVTISVTQETEPPNCPEKYLYTFPKQPTAGLAIATISCTDTDAGLEGQVRYKLADTNTDRAYVTFTVDATSGQISLKSGIVYDSQISHELKVIAYDGGVPSLSTTVTVTVVKGTAPECEGDISTSISSSVPIGHVVADLQCKDSDPGDTLTYRFLNGNHFGIFEVADGQLRTAKLLGETPAFVMEIEVSDSTNAKISILVKISTNSHAPVIFDLLPNFSVKETISAGTILTSCTVTDQDRERGGLAGQTQVGFKNADLSEYEDWYIDASNCSLIVKKELDYERKTSYNLVVMAWDLDPISPRTVSTTITIDVEDVIENNAPTCPSTYNSYLFISSPIGTVVDRIVCTDSDPSRYGQVYYAMDPSNVDFIMGSFNVHAINGKLTLLANALRESTYEVKIIASDGGTPSLSTTITVFVIVGDKPPTTTTESSTDNSAENMKNASILMFLSLNLLVRLLLC